MFTETQLRRKLQEILAIPAEFCISKEPCPETELTAGERIRLQDFSHPIGRTNWLKGRAALKGLLRKWGLPEDSSALQFPNACFSLTHSGGIAIAGGIRSGTGFGLDYEAGRKLQPETARFFLNDSEQKRLNPDFSNHLLRLWTVKEALFKADLANAGKVLRDYRLHDPLAVSGEAVGPEKQGKKTIYRYASLEWETGFLSIALPASFAQASA